MKLGEFRKSIESMAEQAEMSIGKVKRCKLRITQAVYDGDMNPIRSDEKQIVGIQLDPDAEELVISVADDYQPKR